MPTVLLISPYFAPMSVVGAKRPLMLARQLPRFGWNPVVLTSGPGRESVDPSLSDAIPADLPVIREYGAAKRPKTAPAGGPPGEKPRGVFGWDSAYFTPFDRYLWSTPGAYRTALQLVRQYHPRAIHVSADPWSPLLLGVRLSRHAGLPLIADLRDPWSLQAAKMALRPPPTRWLVRTSEARVFRAAAKIVLNTEACREAYVSAYRGRIPAERFTVIRNAYDLGLFEDRPGSHPDAFVVLHFGQFRRLSPGEPLLRGFARFVGRERLSPEQVRLALAGRVRAEEEELIGTLSLERYVHRLNAVPYRESLTLLRSADALALVTMEGMALTIPAKLYDYFAARRPILAITDQPEPARLVSDTGAGLVVPPHDLERIADGLGLLRARAARPDRGEVPAAAVAPFSAEVQAERFAAVLNEVAR